MAIYSHNVIIKLSLVTYIYGDKPLITQLERKAATCCKGIPGEPLCLSGTITHILNVGLVEGNLAEVHWDLCVWIVGVLW